MAKAVMSYLLLMREAKKTGADQNQLFKAAAKTYDSQAKRKAELENKIAESGMTVEKTYVKGTPNIMANPLLDILQKLEDSMNRTLGTMKDIIVAFGRKPEEPDDGLGDFRM